MSPETEVGQLLVPSVPGRRAALTLIDKYRVGGFVYYASDTRTPEQTAALSNALQQESDLPLLIGVGDAQTATYLTPLPGDQTVAAAHSADDARALARVSSAEAHAVGITPGYGPVTGADDIHLATRNKIRSVGAAVAAIKGGADQLIDPPDVPRTYAALVKAVHKGTISQARLDEAVSRILRLKQARGLFGDTRADPARAGKLVGSSATRAVARSVAAHAVTVVKNDQSTLPIPTKDQVFVMGPESDKLSKALRAAGLHVTGSPHKADIVVLATQDEGRNTPTRVRFAARHNPVVLVALGKPDDLAHPGRAAASVAAYSGDDASLAAVAGVLAGSVHPRGKLPTGISSAYPAGYGLSF